MITWKSEIITLSVAIALAMGGAAIHARDSGPADAVAASQKHEAANEAEQVVRALDDRSMVTPGLTQDEFEFELSERFLGTHQLYQVLSEEAKAEVYAHYQADNNIDTIRRLAAYSM
jgi:acetyl-CoA carboxylase carboxyltransferase component